MRTYMYLHINPYRILNNISSLAHHIRDDEALVISHEMYFVRLSQYGHDVFDLVVQNDVFLPDQL